MAAEQQPIHQIIATHCTYGNNVISPRTAGIKFGDKPTPFYSVSLAGNYLSPVINLTRSQIFSYDLLHHGLFYTA
jgi:hypothetical protein